MLAARLSVAIFATITGTPMIGLAYEGRLQELMISLDLGEFVHNWHTVDPANFGRVAVRAW